MKLKIDMIDVIRETMSKFPLVDIYTSKFLMGKIIIHLFAMTVELQCQFVLGNI